MRETPLKADRAKPRNLASGETGASLAAPHPPNAATGRFLTARGSSRAASGHRRPDESENSENPSCLNCDGPAVARNRNGVPKEFCSDDCRRVFDKTARREWKRVMRRRKERARRPPKPRKPNPMKHPAVRAALVLGLALLGREAMDRICSDLSGGRAA